MRLELNIIIVIKVDKIDKILNIFNFSIKPVNQIEYYFS